MEDVIYTDKAAMVSDDKKGVTRTCVLVHITNIQHASEALT